MMNYFFKAGSFLLKKIRSKLICLKLRLIGVKIGKNVNFWGGLNFRCPVGFEKNIRIGDNTEFGRNVSIILSGKSPRLTIGKEASIGPQTRIACQDELNIGDFCLVSHDCFITCANHGFKMGEHVIKQESTTAPTTIGEGTWLGHNVSVLKGVTIGKGCVIGTSAVVNKDIPEYSIAVGIPAKVVKKRK